MDENQKCPRCRNNKFEERDCGPDGYDDDITWTSYVCTKCGLWYSDWEKQWLIDVEDWHDENDAKIFEAK